MRRLNQLLPDMVWVHSHSCWSARGSNFRQNQQSQTTKNKQAENIRLLGAENHYSLQGIQFLLKLPTKPQFSQFRMWKNIIVRGFVKSLKAKDKLVLRAVLFVMQDLGMLASLHKRHQNVIWGDLTSFGPILRPVFQGPQLFCVVAMGCIWSSKIFK